MVDGREVELAGGRSRGEPWADAVATVEITSDSKAAKRGERWTRRSTTGFRLPRPPKGRIAKFVKRVSAIHFLSARCFASLTK